MQEGFDFVDSPAAEGRGGIDDPWREALRSLKVTPIRKRPFSHKDAPVIVNMVSTVSILRKGYKLPLQAIATALGACSQFEPSQFAADIIKLTNSTSDVTVLVFSSGKLVLTATVTELHTTYMLHVFRLLIENVQCVMRDEATEAIETGTLAGRTVFENALTHNMVGHGDLGVNIDLRALRNANPNDVKWLPGGFPAAKCCVWLTEDNTCHCSLSERKEDEDVMRVVPKLLRKRCACTIKCLCFPTGRIVMTGGRSVRDINSVFYRMKELAPHFEVGIRAILVKNVVVPRPNGAGNHKERAKKTLSEEEAIALLFSSVYNFKPKRIKCKTQSANNALLYFAEAGALANVMQTLQMEPSQMENVSMVVARLSHIERTAAQTRVLDYLKGLLVSDV